MQQLTDEGVKFLDDWHRRYPEASPISYLFKQHLPKRWVRIHSLPEAQRYPSGEADWDILLQRQNAVIAHLVAPGTPMQIIYNWIGRDNHLHRSENLTRLGSVSVAGDEVEFECWLSHDTWQPRAFNTLLMMIAEEQLRAFFIAPSCLIAPYDGGMDIILDDAHTAHALKRHFANWLSHRPDGL